MTKDIEMQIRNARYDAELNEEYFRARAARASRLDRVVQGLAAVTSVGAVTAWFTHGGLAPLWAALLVASAGLSATGPIVRWFDDAVKFTDLASQWSRVAGRLRVLSLKSIDDQAASARLQKIAMKAEALQSADTSAPDDKLIEKLREKIERRHGLSTT